MTEGKPITTVPPWDVISPMRAAGAPQILTVIDPIAIESRGPTHSARSPARAAGSIPIMTVEAPIITGPPTCGMLPVT
jgi:hypothetical protein